MATVPTQPASRVGGRHPSWLSLSPHLSRVRRAETRPPAPVCELTLSLAIAQVWPARPSSDPPGTRGGGQREGLGESTQTHPRGHLVGRFIRISYRATRGEPAGPRPTSRSAVHEAGGSHSPVHSGAVTAHARPASTWKGRRGPRAPRWHRQAPSRCARLVGKRPCGVPPLHNLFLMKQRAFDARISLLKSVSI